MSADRPSLNYGSTSSIASQQDISIPVIGQGDTSSAAQMGAQRKSSEIDESNNNNSNNDGPRYGSRGSRTSTTGSERRYRSHTERTSGIHTVPPAQFVPSETGSGGNDDNEDEKGLVDGVMHKEPNCVDKALNFVLPPGSIAASAFNLCAATLGAGTLGLPYAMDHTGAVLGSILLVACGAGTVYTCDLLIHTLEKTGLGTYEALSKHLIGPKFEKLVAGLIILFCWGVACAYVVVVGTIIKPLQAIQALPQGVWGDRLMTFVFWLAFMMPLSMLRDINSLRYASLVGFLATVYLVLAIIVYAANGGDGKTESKQIDVSHAVDFNFWSSITVFSFAYCCLGKDMELLTDKGFIGYEEAKRLWLRGELRVAAFHYEHFGDKKKKKDIETIRYEKPTHFVDNAGAPGDGLYEIRDNSDKSRSCISVTVTGKHQMLTQLMSDDTPWRKKTVEELAKSGKDTQLHLMSRVTGGLDNIEARPLWDEEMLGEQIFRLAPALRQARDRETNVEEEENQPTVAMVCAAFLKIFGFWLGDGSLFLLGRAPTCSVMFSQANKGDIAFLRTNLKLLGLVERADADTVYARWEKNGVPNKSPEDAIVNEKGIDYDFSLYLSGGKQLVVAVRNAAWNNFFKSEYAAKYEHGLNAAHHGDTADAARRAVKAQFPDVDPDTFAVSNENAESAKWLPGWAFRLARENGRALLWGLTEATGRSTTTPASVQTQQRPNNRNYVRTSSTHFRDQLVHFCTLMGLAAHAAVKYDSGADRGLGVATRAHFAVHYSQQRHNIRACDVKKIEATDPVNGHLVNAGTWCVTVPSGNIIVRRRVAPGAPPARPIVIGNCQTNVFEIYHELADATPQRLKKAAMVGMTFCTALYIMAGLAGLASFGHTIQSNILSMYTSPQSTAYLMMAYVAISFTVTLAFPVAVFPTRDACLQMLGFATAYDTPDRIRYLVCFCISLSALLVGLFVPNIQVMFSILGGVCGSSLGYCMPPLFAWKAGVISWEEGKKANFILASVVFTVGAIFGTLGTITTIISLAEGNTTAPGTNSTSNLTNFSTTSTAAAATTTHPALALLSGLLN